MTYRFRFLARTSTGLWSLRLLLLSSFAAAASLGACGGQTSSEGDGDSTATGDGDVTTASSGDGDGTTTDSGGDGDGTTGETGDGDGDGTTGETGDGDGDGTGGEAQCTSDADCVVVWPTEAPCFSPGCSLPIAAPKTEADADPCLVPWEESEVPSRPDGCSYDGDVLCDASCAAPPECAAARCDDEGMCQVDMGYNDQECDSEQNDLCAGLEEAFNSALAEARSCLAGGVSPTTECDAAESISDLCGCPQAVSSEKSTMVAAAELAKIAYQDQCAAPEFCQLVDCAQKTEQGACQLTEHPDGVCVFE